MPTGQCESLWKATQRQLFTFLSSKSGLTICIAGLFITLISAFQFGEVALQWSRQHYERKFDSNFDNIAGRNFQDRMCLPQPIDIVYTWVNGSDPLLLKNLAALKLQLEIERNMTAQARNTAENLRRLEEELAYNASNHTTTAMPTTTSTHTTHAPSTAGPGVRGAVWVVPDLFSLGISRFVNLTDENRAVAAHMAIEEECGYVEGVDLESLERGGIVQISRTASVTACLNKTITAGTGQIHLSQVYLICNSTLDGLVHGPRGTPLAGKVLFALGSYKTAVLVDVPTELPDKILQETLSRFGEIVGLHRYAEQGIASVTYQQRFSMIDLMAHHALEFAHSAEAGWREVQPASTTTATTTTTTSTRARPAPPPPEQGNMANLGGGRRPMRRLLSDPHYFRKGPDSARSSTPSSSTAGSTAGPDGLTHHTVRLVFASQAIVLPGVDPADVMREEDEEGSHPVEEAQGAESDEVSSSRFQDNSELQYSLRSVEKYAPWVRHIYIVTNGQIPGWLNLEHPRISVVTHDDIFLNKSHLPTFSSPSIETHLHRIPGLSKKFIYLNDDVMFGTEVWPDDFYTHAKGQKIFLAWPVPNCEEGCPSNWIGDKYCDIACNTSSCDYDGGDCLGKTGAGRDTYHSWSNSQSSSASTQYCNQGCADSWMGDKYCDRACDVPQCGFDAGDCGLEKVVDKFPGFLITDTHAVVRQDQPVEGQFPRVIHLNFSSLVHNTTIKEASVEGPDVLHAAVMSQLHKVLVLVFRENIGINATAIRIVVTTAATEPHLASFSLNMTVNTTKAAAAAGIVVPEVHAALNHSSSANATNASVVPVRLVDGSTINYWDVHNLTTPAPNLPVRSSFPAIVVGNESLKLLPAHVQESLRLLDEELQAGDLTHKGYARRRFVLLQPFFTLLNITATAPSALAQDFHKHDARGDAGQQQAQPVQPGRHLAIPHHNAAAGDAHGDRHEAPHAPALADPARLHRRLLALESVLGLPSLAVEDPAHAAAADHPELFAARMSRRRAPPRLVDPSVAAGPTSAGAEESTQAPSEEEPATAEVLPLGGYVTRNGRRVRADEAAAADWIANTKAKQLSLKADLERSIRAWEAAVGRAWSPADVPDTHHSSFPWERKHIFDHLDTAIATHDWRGRRHLLDTFGDSLKHVNKLYNKAFGYTPRRVIAHMPHMLDRDILDELEEQFWAEWDATSSHPLRSSNDMQYAFAYFYYLVGKAKPFNISEQFAVLDTDHDGVLSANELRTLATRLYDVPIKADNWNAFSGILLNCSSLQPPLEILGVAIGPHDQEVWVTERLVSNCTELLSLMVRTVGKQSKYKYELDNDEKDIAFKMIRNNATEVTRQLDAIRKNPQKFVCLNDNVDHRKKSAQDVVTALHNFYESFFPVRSQFELPLGFRNRFLHVSELRAWHAEQAKTLFKLHLALGLLVVVLLCYLCSSQLRRCRRYFLTRTRLISARV